MFLKIKKVLEKYFFCDKRKSDIRNVVQPGRTLRSGRRGRWFESSHSDHNKSRPLWAVFVMVRNKDFSNQRGAGLTTSERQTGVCRSAMPMSAEATQTKCRVVQSFRPHQTARIF